MIIIGLMIAIQFKAVKEPIVRDTRDTWQLREDLQKEKDLELKLLREIRSNEEKIVQYETERKHSKEKILRDTLDELKMEAGLSEVTGDGIIITITPVYEKLLLGHAITSVTPDLIKRLLNEINRYGAQYVSIAGHRVINTTVIREINDETKIDGYPLSQLPLEVKVIAENNKAAELLYKRMQVSKSAEDFFIDNLRIEVMRPDEQITIPAYEDTIRILHMKPVKPKNGGDS
ncbi:DUF881 domain-containing protein [Cytobacillus purgationiresistens]|nr:DUF881 domain-containing protein [Cytobacillus purgationiresistens]